MGPRNRGRNQAEAVGKNAKRGNMSKTVPVVGTGDAVGSRSPSPASGQPETECSNEMFHELESKK